MNRSGTPSLHSPLLLTELFQELNLQWFNSELHEPILRWNSRLRSSSGRFSPGRVRESQNPFLALIQNSGGRFSFGGLTGSRSEVPQNQPVIELASYLRNHQELSEEARFHQIRDTLGHEMIHYWLWCRGKNYGHTPEFYRKMREMGVSRFNTVPKHRPRFVYACPQCKGEFESRKRFRARACLKCCKEFAHGKYDERFKLNLIRSRNPPKIG